MSLPTVKVTVQYIDGPRESLLERYAETRGAISWMTLEMTYFYQHAVIESSFYYRSITISVKRL